MKDLDEVDEYSNGIEEMFEDLKSLNNFYEKDYINLEDFYKIRNNIIDKVIKTSEYEQEFIKNQMIKI